MQISMFRAYGIIISVYLQQWRHNYYVAWKIDPVNIIPISCNVPLADRNSTICTVSLNYACLNLIYRQVLLAHLSIHSSQVIAYRSLMYTRGLTLGTGSPYIREACRDITLNPRPEISRERSHGSTFHLQLYGHPD